MILQLRECQRGRRGTFLGSTCSGTVNPHWLGDVLEGVFAKVFEAVSKLANYMIMHRG